MDPDDPLGGHPVVDRKDGVVEPAPPLEQPDHRPELVVVAEHHVRVELEEQLELPGVVHEAFVEPVVGFLFRQVLDEKVLPAVVALAA